MNRLPGRPLPPRRTDTTRRMTRRRRWVSWLTAGALMLSGVGLSVVVAAPAQAAGPTIVSLTFDDGDASQLAAAQTLKDNGLRGTFFITSGLIGEAGHLTRANLNTLAANGNEIGGHTVTHPDLTTLPADEVARQICNDRVNLTNWGFSVTSFAYPFASHNAAVDQAVADCGYNSGRGLGDVKSRFSCSGCAVAETLPPGNRYDTAAPDQISSQWTLTDLRRSVTQAQGTGGWVQFTFHEIATGTDPSLSITPTLFRQFATWLRQQQSSGAIQVKTVHEAVGGTVKPAVSGPAVPAQPAGGNLVRNPGLETLSGGIPQCWQQGGYGTNTPRFSIVSPGHGGNNASRLVMSGYSNGDAKLLPALDLGGCSPSATPGRTYRLGAWYTSTVSTQFALYYRTSEGTWRYWTSSPYFAAAGSYQKAEWTTPPVPAGATGISFGLNLFSNGTLTVDDFEMYDSANIPTPPPPPAGTNLVQNASLETAGSGGIPQCWQTSGFGVNTAAFSTVSAAHSGTKAERLVVSGYSSGDAKLLPSMTAANCAPAAVAGHSYSMRAWYTSTATTQFAAYYKNASGTWVYWTSSPWFPASSTYTQAVFTTPALPAGATAISFGLNLFSNGTLTTDDYALYDVVGAPAP